ncbi:MAG: 60S ribosomal protein L22 [Promethearchaeota archaeon]
MARKKKVELSLYQLDVSKISVLKEKYIEQIMQYLEENVTSSEIAKEGNKVNINVPSSISKKFLKLRIKKYLYQAGLKDEFKIVALPKGEVSGFQILNR